MTYMNTVMSGIEAYMYIWGGKPIMFGDESNWDLS